MPLSVVGRVSADNGNALQAGSDGGLFMPANPYRGPTSAYVIDNSWAGSGSGGQYWYTSQANFAGGFNFNAYPSGFGLMWPIAFARDCTIGTSVIRSANAATTTATMYLSMYASSAATGLPGAKVVDLLSWNVGTTTATYSSNQLNASPTFKANTLYWATTWTVGTGIPSIFTSYGVPAAVRSSGTQGSLALQGSAPLVAYVDNTSSFTSATGPATLSPVLDHGAAVNLVQTGQYVPKIYWGLTNV